MTVAVKPAADPKTLGVVDDLVRRARAAMAAFADADQARVDEAVTALAWSLYNPAHAKELAEPLYALGEDLVGLLVFGIRCEGLRLGMGVPCALDLL